MGANDSLLNLFLSSVQSAGRSSYTLVYYRNSLTTWRRFLTQSDTLLSKATNADVRAFLTHYQQPPYKVKYAATLYRAVRAFYRWCMAEKLIDHDPLHNVKAPKENKELLDPVDLADIKALVDSCDDSFHGRRDRALILFLFDTGVRILELLSLKVSDLDIAGGRVKVWGKGAKERWVFFGSTTRIALTRYVIVRPGPESALWVDRDGNGLTRWGVRLMLERRAKRASVTGTVTPHAFRRACALNMLRNGIDLPSLQLILGHEDLSVLRRYLNQLPDDLQAAHRQASPVDGLLGKKKRGGKHT